MRFLLFSALLGVSFGRIWAAQPDETDLIDPHSGAMGNISIYSSHIENPSLSASLTDKQLSISYKNHYWVNELSSWKCSFSSPTPWFAAGLSFAGYGYEHYNRFSIGGNLGRSLSPCLAIGIGLNLHSLYYAGSENRKNSLTLRAGAAFTSGSHFLASCWIDNPFQTGFYTQYGEKEKIPPVIYGGFRLFLTEETQWSVEVENRYFSTWRAKTGFEYGIKSFAIRCGVFGMPIVPTAGAGFSFSGFSLDLSAQYHTLLGTSLCCGLKWML